MQTKKIFLLALIACFIMSCWDFPGAEDEIPYLLGLETVGVDYSEENTVAASGTKYIETASYQLSANTIKEFEALENKQIDRRKTKNWIAQNWAPTPADSSSEALYNDLLLSDYFGEEPIVNQENNEVPLIYNKNDFEKGIVKAYRNTGAYHAAYFKPNKENPERIEFYVLEIANKKLYTIGYDFPVVEELED